MGIFHVLGLFFGAKQFTGISKDLRSMARDVSEIKDDLTGERVDRQTLQRLTERIEQSVEVLGNLSVKFERLNVAVKQNTDVMALFSLTLAAGVETFIDIANLLSEKYGEHEKAAEIRARVLRIQAPTSPTDDAAS